MTACVRNLTMNRRCICCRAKTEGDSLVHAAQFSSVQSLSCVRLSVTPWTAARYASLSITNSRSLNKSTTNSVPFLLLFMYFHVFLLGRFLFPPLLSCFNHQGASLSAQIVKDLPDLIPGSGRSPGEGSGNPL